MQLYIVSVLQFCHIHIAKILTIGVSSRPWDDHMRVREQAHHILLYKEVRITSLLLTDTLATQWPLIIYYKIICIFKFCDLPHDYHCSQVVMYVVSY